jgi:hypothetical protein
MRPVVVSVTGAGTSPVVAADYIQTPFNASISVVVSGTVNYTIQHTFDDIFAAGFDPATANWFSHDQAVMVSATANQDSNYSAPIRGCRILQNSGAGTTTLTYIQGLGV